MTKLKEILRIIFRKNEKEEGQMKTKMSLKKKLLLGGGLLGGLVLGIFALGRNSEEEDIYDDFYEDDFDEFDDSEDEESENNEEVEATEETQE